MAHPAFIAHYKLTSKLGAGGMGEVYRATDTRLDREVAIKILPDALANDPERLARFTREAKVLASLNHPNIATIYGVEEGALVMELIEGDTLVERIAKGPIPVEEAVRIAEQIADALEYAHERGVIHRDLKPANVKAGTRVKVLDFGLAKVQEMVGSDETISGATQAGTILGSAGYMSPEQAECKPVDARADVFSFGVLLYEMLSGTRAFCESSPISTMMAILRKEPRPLREIAPHVSTALESIVTRCMAKDPSARFSGMGPLKQALKELAQPAARPSETPSIAVLPFANLSADKENEYFSDGLAEEILIALSQVVGLRVAARSSSFSFKGKNTEMSEIASKLHVANVLDGSVRRAGNRVRVTVQLVDAKNGFQLWSKRYDRQMEDIFEVQDEIARAIADQLEVTLGAGVKPATQNLEAYELYLKGRHLCSQRSPSSVRLGMKCFQQALEFDPGLALAWSGLADCYGILRVYGWISHEEGKPPALAAVTKAVELAPELWEVDFSRAIYAFYFVANWREAGPHFQKAIEKNPHSSLAHAYYGIFLALDRRPEEASAHVTLASQLDPLSPFIHGLASLSFVNARQIEPALRLAQQSVELQADYLFGNWAKGLSLCLLGRNEEAVETLEKVIVASRAPLYIGLLGTAYGRAGRREDATRLLHELEDRGSRGEFIPAFSLLSICAGWDDIPAIRQALASAQAESTPAFSLTATSALFLDKLRSDPEINRMLVEIFGY
ncbi:MAG: protein kinase [Terracidiphilus sp.]|jgi:serine/threonine protein kinase/Flp pilus assembly protein TadD